jgi:hypothetical protein
MSVEMRYPHILFFWYWNGWWEVGCIAQDVLVWEVLDWVHDSDGEHVADED